MARPGLWTWSPPGTVLGRDRTLGVARVKSGMREEDVPWAWPGRVGGVVWAGPGPTHLLLALHPTHVDVAGVGAPGQLLRAEGAGKGAGSPAALEAPALGRAAFTLLPIHLNSNPTPPSIRGPYYPLVPQLCGRGGLQLHPVQVVPGGRV